MENLQAQKIGLNLSYSRRCRTYCILPVVIVAWLSAVPLQPPAIPASASRKLEISTAGREKEKRVKKRTRREEVRWCREEETRKETGKEHGAKKWHNLITKCTSCKPSAGSGGL